VDDQAVGHYKTERIGGTIMESTLVRLSSTTFCAEPTVKKVWTKDEIRENILKSSKWVERAIVAVYQRQTALEKQAECTSQDNNVGFSACDAHSGSYMAKWILGGRSLSGKWLEKGRKMALKYCGQLTTYANS
jgi:hypothetical protein